MDVSHFELVFKPQSPAAPVGVPAVDRLIQGYFLEITNLEAQPFSYRLTFVAAPVTDPLRSLAGNTVVFVDTPGVNNQSGVLNGAITGTRFSPSTGLITIPAQGTALVAVLPSAFGPVFDPTPLTAPTFEVRGHVQITLPARIEFSLNPPRLRFVPQSTVPVKVLLTPQNRTTYLTAAGAISDQTQASLPLASGAALNAITPETGFFSLPATLSLAESRTLFETGDAPSGEMLAALLTMIDPKGDDLPRFNKALAAAGVGLALERAKATVPA